MSEQVMSTPTFEPQPDIAEQSPDIIEELRARLKRLEQENAEKDQIIKAKDHQISQLEGENELLEDRNDKLVTYNNEITTSNNELAAKVDRAEKNNTGVIEQLANLEEEIILLSMQLNRQKSNEGNLLRISPDRRSH